MTAPEPPALTVRTCETCGHVGRYGTAALAEYHFGRHSCVRVVQRRERAARRVERLAGGGPKPCLCKYADHAHGDRGRYVVDMCRCQPCRVANSRYEASRKRDVMYGLAKQVDAGPARQHVRSLMAQGMGIRRIVATAGVSHSVVAKLLYGHGLSERSTVPDHEVRLPTKRLERGVAAKLLAVELDLAPGARVGVVGTTRRLQALVAIGWSQARLAHALGVSPNRLTGLVHGTRTLTWASAQAVAALYEQLWDQQPPHADGHDRASYNRALRFARAHGWVPPMAWDDDTIDLPDAQPDAPVADLDDRRPLDVDEVEFLTDQGVTRDAIAHQLHTSVDHINRALHRASRRDLWVRLCARDGIVVADTLQGRAA